MIVNKNDTPKAAVLKSVRVAGDLAYEVRRRDEPGWMVFRGDQELIEADVEIPVRQTASGVWMYGGQAVRAGASFSFQTTWYAMNGTIATTSASPPNLVESTRQEKK